MWLILNTPSGTPSLQEFVLTIPHKTVEKGCGHPWKQATRTIRKIHCGYHSRNRLQMGAETIYECSGNSLGAPEIRWDTLWKFVVNS